VRRLLHPGSTVPFVNPKIMVLGFAVTGRAGKASPAEALLALLDDVDDLDGGPDGATDGFEDDEDEATHGVALTRP